MGEPMTHRRLQDIVLQRLSPQDETIPSMIYQYPTFHRAQIQRTLRHVHLVAAKTPSKWSQWFCYNCDEAGHITCKCFKLVKKTAGYTRRDTGNNRSRTNAMESRLDPAARPPLGRRFVPFTSPRLTTMRPAMLSARKSTPSNGQRSQ